MRASPSQPPSLCRLCLEEAKLCRSHIIPEFLYAELYDENHRFIEVASVTEGVVRQGQLGYREKLLCDSCEATLSRWERHARRLFVDELPPFAEKSARLREHKRADYLPTKLFFLSILWRASVSSLSIFKHVSLGPHEERIRQMLMQADPGGMLDYPVSLFALHMMGNHFKNFMVEPTYMRVDGRRCYRIVVRGFVVIIYVDSVKIVYPHTILVMDPEKPIRTFDSDLGDFKFLKRVWETAARTTKDIEI